MTEPENVGSPVFAENLPNQCPPTIATDGPWTNVYRLLHQDTPTENCFQSHAALGKPLPKSLGDACAWASCSLTTDPKMLKKLQGIKMKHSHAALLEIPAGAGLGILKKQHVDFWRFSTFDILKAVVTVEEL